MKRVIWTSEPCEEEKARILLECAEVAGDVLAAQLAVALYENLKSYRDKDAAAETVLDNLIDVAAENPLETAFEDLAWRKFEPGMRVVYLKEGGPEFITIKSVTRDSDGDIRVVADSKAAFRVSEGVVICPPDLLKTLALVEESGRVSLVDGDGMEMAVMPAGQLVGLDAEKIVDILIEEAIGHVL